MAAVLVEEQTTLDVKAGVNAKAARRNKRDEGESSGRPKASKAHLILILRPRQRLLLRIGARNSVMYYTTYHMPCGHVRKRMSVCDHVMAEMATSCVDAWVV